MPRITTEKTDILIVNGWSSRWAAANIHQEGWKKYDGKCKSDNEKKDGSLPLGWMCPFDCGGDLSLSDGSGTGKRIH